MMPHELTPVVDQSDPVEVCRFPDLGELNHPDPSRHNIVDHSFVQLPDDRWLLWATLRNTRVGHIVFGWEAASLTQSPWQELGVVARADPAWGETHQLKPDGSIEEGMGIPHFVVNEGLYYCFYNTRSGIRLMTSDDGRNYRRLDLGRGRGNLLYTDGGRDLMILNIDGLWHAYSCRTVNRAVSYVMVKTSRNLIDWERPRMVSMGGRAGNGPVDAESPFVVQHEGCFYLWRSSSISFKTFVYRSADPYDFGIDDDRCLIAEFDLKAPEIICHQGQWFVSDLDDFSRLVLRKLDWD
jgi:hypothetical protein